MKRNSPAYPRIATCLIGAASTVASFHAGAFQLGQIQSTSRLGEPLAAHINVMISPRESLLGTTLAVLPDFDYRNDPVMKDALKTITAKLVRNQYGQHYIAISSSRELNLPLLSFRLKATNGDNTLIQSYSLSPSPVRRTTAQAIGRRRAAKASTQVATPSDGSITGTEYGPVKSGDTLWKIATKVAGREQAGAILHQLFELNPHAFINGDINKLKQGVTLSLPSNAGAQRIAVEKTKAAEEPTSPTITPAMIAPALSVPETLESADLASSTPEPLTATSDSQIITGNVFEEQIRAEGDAVQSNIGASNTSSTPVDWRAENPEVSEKLSELSAKYAALRARYAGQTDSDLTGTLTTEDSSAEESLTAVAETQALPPLAQVDFDDEKAPATEIVAPIENMRESDAAITETDITPYGAPKIDASNGASRFELPSWMLVLLGLGLIVSAAGYVLHRAGVTSKRKAEQLARMEKDSSLKQELAKKAQHRILMEDEVERMLHDQVEDDGDEIEQTMQLHVGELVPEPIEAITTNGDDSAESRIDASISHGRYAEAEDLLREVIDGSPRNFTAKLRLAEVYYITEKISDFVSISQDIHAHHRPDISDEDWRRVMRMGKMIAPEQPPFSGPQSIMDDASAG